MIRRWHHRDRISIREIERRTGLSRNTIRKYLRSNAVEVRFKVPERPSRLDPFADKLSEWLRVEAGKGRKGRRTVLDYCRATANQFRLMLHTGAYWLLWSLRSLMPRRSTWRVAQFDTLRLLLVKLATRVVSLKTRIMLHLPSAYPDKAVLRLALERLPRLTC